MAKKPNTQGIDFKVEPDEWLSVGVLLTMFHPFNSQMRTERELESIKRSIKENGFIGEFIIVNTWNKKIVSGHGRVKATFEMGYTGDLPVVHVFLDSEEEHRHEMLRWNKARGHQDPDKEQAEIMALLEKYGVETLEADYGMPEGWLDEYAEEISELEDAELEPAPPPSGNAGAAFKTFVHVKPVLAVNQLALFEQALAATGLANRGEAMIEICRHYLLRGSGDGDHENEAGQPDADEKGIIAAALSEGD